jgi:shikimate dehydrogenase
LAHEGVASLWLMNRTIDKATSLAREVELNCPQVRIQVGYPDGDVDLLLNATSAGLRPDDPMPLDIGRISWNRVRAVYDFIYQPTGTPLLAWARRAGCRVANGLGLLLYQGARTLELWTGRPAPLDVMRQALQAYSHHTSTRRRD